jgi:hypothetical protein
LREGQVSTYLPFAVDSFQLYQICSITTWVAIYSSNGTFQNVGMLDARELNGGNVQFESTLPAALAGSAV